MESDQLVNSFFIAWRTYHGKEEESSEEETNEEESSKEENRGNETSQEEINQKEEKINICLYSHKGRRCLYIDGFFLILTSRTYLIAKFVVCI